MLVRMLSVGAVCLMASCAGAGRSEEASAQLVVEPEVTAVAVQEVDPAVKLEEELKLVERLTARIEILRAHEGELIGYGYQREPEAQRRQWERNLSDFDQRLSSLDESGAITTPTALRRLRENVLLPLEDLREKE